MKCQCANYYMVGSSYDLFPTYKKCIFSDLKVIYINPLLSSAAYM